MCFAGTVDHDLNQKNENAIIDVCNIATMVIGDMAVYSVLLVGITH